MPHEIGKHQIVLGLISSITQMRSKKALFFLLFHEKENEEKKTMNGNIQCKEEGGAN